MKQYSLSSLEIYINKVFKNLIVIIPSITLCAGMTFSVLHALGFYPETRQATILIFDMTCVIYTLIGIFFNRNCEGEDGLIKPKMLWAGKIFIAVLMFVQWNFISYMIPSRDYWAYFIFFILSSALFLDSKYVLIVCSEVVVSMLASWVCLPDVLLPVRDERFPAEMALRCVLVVLACCEIYAFTLTIEKRLAKELEKISDFDTLTMLHNRRKLEKTFENAVATRKKDGKFSVIIADIDDFKVINDTYGHSCGDEVLKDVADIFRNASADCQAKCNTFRRYSFGER